jgi:hypothetical protein
MITRSQTLNSQGQRDPPSQPSPNKSLCARARASAARAGEGERLRFDRRTIGAHLASLTVEPFDPLKPAPRNNGLNSYDRQHDRAGADGERELVMARGNAGTALRRSAATTQ